MDEPTSDQPIEARERDLARREAALEARIAEAESVLRAADGRDAAADARDRTAEERDRDADRRAFLSRDAEYGDDAPSRRDAALDRGHAKGNRTDSADDRARLTDDLDDV